MDNIDNINSNPLKFYIELRGDGLGILNRMNNMIFQLCGFLD